MANAQGFAWMKTGRAAALVRPGDGGTIVIVHGGMADAESWLPFAAALRTSMSVAIFNRQGRPPSDELRPGSTMSDEVEDVRQVMSRLQGPFILFGWSLGGLLAIEAAVGRSDITSIVLYEPVCRPFVPASVEPISRAVEAGDLDRAVELVLTEISRAPAEQIVALRSSPAWDQFKTFAIPAGVELAALNAHDPDFAAYACIEAPLTIIVGALNEDHEVYGAAFGRFLDHLPDTTKVVLPGQGHLAHIEDPALLAKTIDAAIAQIDR